MAGVRLSVRRKPIFYKKKTAKHTITQPTRHDHGFIQAPVGGKPPNFRNPPISEVRMMAF